MIFKKNKKQYKVYTPKNASDFKKIINNPKVKSIYIFGHGVKHGIKLNKKEVLYYCEMKNTLKKDFIAQLHCNHSYGNSLADYIGKNSYVVDGKRNSFKNLKYYFNLYHKNIIN